MSDTDSEADRPLDGLRVITGAPDELELAAIAAVLQAVAEEAAAHPAARPAPPSRWLESRRSLRTALPQRWG